MIPAPLRTSSTVSPWPGTSARSRSRRSASRSSASSIRPIDFSVFLIAYYYLHWPLVAGQRARLARRGDRLLRDEFASSPSRPNPAASCAGATTRRSSLRRRRPDRQHRDPVRAVLLMPVLAAKLLAIVASFVVNFSLSHFVVFRRAAARDAGRVMRRVEGVDMRHDDNLTPSGRLSSPISNAR